MELTRERRLEIYRAVQKVLIDQKDRNGTNSHCFPGFCYLICGSKKQFESNKLSDYPELYKHKPKYPDGSFWYPVTTRGVHKRIRVIKKAVRETEKAIAAENKRNNSFGLRKYMSVYVRNFKGIFIGNKSA